MEVDVVVVLLMFLLIGLVLPLPASPLSFNFSKFSPGNPPNITYQSDAQPSSDGVIELTKNVLDKSINQSRGWALYSQPVRLWDAATQNLTNFTTAFSFFVNPMVNNTYPGDGLAFFLAPNGSSIPRGVWGGTLALFDDGENLTTTPPPRQIVAVEFDTFQNLWDPMPVHIGIDVGSIVSVAQVPWADSLNQSDKASVNATVTYDAGAMELSAVFSGEDGTKKNLSHVVDLRQVLPEWVIIGFSASTGAAVELHKIRSWSFYSSLEVSDQTPASNFYEPSPSPAPAPSPSSPPLPPEKNHKSRIGLVAGLMGGCGFLAAVSGVVWFILWQRKVTRWRREGSGVELGIIDDSEINEGRGPKRFTYPEIARATRNFAHDRKLGRGGFGEVYKGFLSELGLDVAVKRVARNSTQGKKEYLAEINIISRLRHRNLVQLVGWCHDQCELLLVYEYLPNGSLDAHLFGGGGKAPQLAWRMRYKIAQGLASALLYLHEGFEQCVVHRDVKSSNVMLDADFNSKLGDFGLARLVDHGLGMQTTIPAGTLGYLAPECAIGTGKASKESDVYSFGVVALEIACGRRSIDPMAEEGKLSLVGWVWGLYGQDALLEAADERLHSDLDEVQMERLMVVGLWCAHPDLHSRPSMRQVVAALNFETLPPSLPDQMPVLTYVPPGSWRHDVAPSSGLSASSSMSTTSVSSSTTGGSYAGAASVASRMSTTGSDAAGHLLALSEPR